MKAVWKGMAVAAVVGLGVSAARAETLTVYWNAGHAWDAYQAVIVPPYSGERKVITWDVNLEKPKAKDEKPSKKK